MATLTLNVNGQTRSVSVSDTGMPLLWVLRDILGLTGTKYGCGAEYCGACTVLVDGQAEQSCDLDVASAVGKAIVTIEGLSADPVGKAVQDAWIANQVPQCGYCQSGMVVVATAAIKAGHHGKEIESELNHICACGTYQRMKTAVQGL